jgi:opacity protein-like surface antigen
MHRPYLPEPVRKRKPEHHGGHRGKNVPQAAPPPFKDENRRPRLRNYAHAFAPRLVWLCGSPAFAPRLVWLCGSPAFAPVPGSGWAGVSWFAAAGSGWAGVSWFAAAGSGRGFAAPSWAAVFCIFPRLCSSPGARRGVPEAAALRPWRGFFFSWCSERAFVFQQGFQQGCGLLDTIETTQTKPTQERETRIKDKGAAPSPTHVREVRPHATRLGAAVWFARLRPFRWLLPLASAGLVFLGLSAAAWWLVRSPCPPLGGGKHTQYCLNYFATTP